MRIPLALASLVLAAQAGAVDPATTAYLRDLRPVLDVGRALNDSVNGTTLDTIVAGDLAPAQKETAVRTFVATRNFYHALLRDADAPVPPAAIYDAMKYMTAAERDQVGRIFVSRLTRQRSSRTG